MLVALAVAYGAVLVSAPSAPVVALGMWWTANTVAHNFIHLPFFRARLANRAFSVYLSLLLGVPQTVWRDRHLAHHAERVWRPRWSRQLALELCAVGILWMAWASLGTGVFVGTWLAGWIGGLILCQLQGYFEHARGTVSHYGWLYNLAFFNDGYHVEHHARPNRHWSELPGAAVPHAAASRWPAVLRWLEWGSLETLERLVLRSRRLQQWIVERHARAFRRVLDRLPPVQRVTIVGGGLFPRTALVIRRLLPSAEITIVDRSARNLACAAPFLDGPVRTIEASFTPRMADAADLLVVPLAYVGDRAAFYACPPAPAVAVHEWLWRRRGEGSIVSLLLLKRLNLVRQ
jgi:hypothetical protein